MKRPMCTLAVSWLAGLILAGRETVIGTNVVLFTYFFLIILGLWVLNKHPQFLNKQMQKEWYPQFTLLLMLIPCLFLAGYHRMESYLERQLRQERPWKLLSEEGETYVTLEGVVCNKENNAQTTLRVTECVIVGYYGQENQTAGDCRIRVEEEGKEWLPETTVGNKIRVFGKFSVFEPAGNPGQFDTYDYYTGKGLFADVSALRITVLDEKADSIANTMSAWKKSLQESIDTLYPQEKAGVLVAMILGDRELLSEELEALYRQNGISHILAISGLHISMLCVGLFNALRKLTVPPKVAILVTVMFLAFYVFFTGAGTSALRAAVMCVIVLGAGWFRRSYDLFSSLALAVIVVTALRPGELSSAGFLLSFGAVLGVAIAKEAEYVIVQLYGGKRPWWCVFLFGGILQLVTTPISLWFFYELSPYSILLNLVVIPLVSFVLGGGILSAVLGTVWVSGAGLLAGGTYILLEFYEWLCKVTQKLPFSFVLAGRPAVWQMVVYYGVLALLLWMFLNKGTWRGEHKAGDKAVNHESKLSEKKSRSFAGWFLLGMFSTVLILFLPGKIGIELWFLDVSQGDGALICTEDGAVILSDCGSSDVSGVGEYRLLPMLRQKGILLVDMAVVSHLDSDHISGIKELLEIMPEFHGDLQFAAGYQGVAGIKELVLPKVQEKSEAYIELESLAQQKGVVVRYLQAGDTLYKEEDLLVECIFPYSAKESENDTSLVLLLQTPQLLVWLMGDAGIAPEAEIMARLEAVNPEALREGKSVLLKVGHHGSKTSSGEDFINFVQPDVAVISCGYHNSYGHPHKEVVERFLEAGVEVLRTDLQGAVVVKMGRLGEPEVSSWRKEERK